MKVTLPCAVYTRKSSEDGLEQGFNSLDAQREACAAFILSQKEQGWRALDSNYDDGGFSGGNTERPALQRLLADVALGRIKIVVVYKVDRLTRSLADFAKLVELFDANGVSFVSVTQQFNTTSSMGRLTLNVLLSFAQFEREVTGERIRDKIAASKAKGMWMGGIPPMGYLPKDRTLVIDEPQAVRIREIYRLYLDLGCVRKLKAELHSLGWLTPPRKNQAPASDGNRPFSRGHLYRILSNPIYNGQIVHKEAVFEGQHQAIVDSQTWTAVQERMKANLQGNRTRATAINPSLLTGLVIDHLGNPLIPAHGKKGERRYRYYVSRPLHEDGPDAAPDALRVPAPELEEAVVQTLARLLKDQQRMMDLMREQGIDEAAVVRAQLRSASQLGDELNALNSSDKIVVLRRIVSQITVHQDKLVMAINPAALWDSKCNAGNDKAEAEPILIEVPVQLKRCGMAVRLVVGVGEQSDRKPDLKLIGLIGKAHDWFARLSSGQREGVAAIAQEEQVTSSYVSRVIQLAFLAPDIVHLIHRGEHPLELNARRLIRMMPLPIDWTEQRKVIGLTG